MEKCIVLPREANETCFSCFSDFSLGMQCHCWFSTPDCRGTYTAEHGSSSPASGSQWKWFLLTKVWNVCLFSIDNKAELTQILRRILRFLRCRLIETHQNNLLSCFVCCLWDNTMFLKHCICSYRCPHSFLFQYQWSLLSSLSSSSSSSSSSSHSPNKESLQKLH